MVKPTNTKYYLFTYIIFLVVCKELPQSKNTYKPDFRYTKVAATNIFSAEILWRLGSSVNERVIAVPAIIDDKRYSTLLNIWPKSISRINRAGEEVIALKPDLAIIASFHNIDQRMVLEKAGIDMIHLDRFTGFTAYRRNVMKIASVMMAQKSGQKLLKIFENRLKNVRARAQEVKVNQTVVSYMYGNTMGSNSTFHDSATAAGLINLSAKKGIVQFKKISVEQIQVWKPDYVVISCQRISCSVAEKKFPQKLGVSMLNSKVIAIPSNILTSSNERMLKLSELIQDRILKEQN